MEKLIKNKKIIILIVVLGGLGIFLGIYLSFREEKNIKKDMGIVLKCDSETIKQGDKLNCTLEGNSYDYEVSAISATIKKSDDYDIVKVTPDSSWEGDGENGDIDLYTDINKTKNFKIAKFTIVLKDTSKTDIEINIVDNSFFDQEFVENKIDNVTKKIKVEK